MSTDPGTSAVGTVLRNPLVWAAVAMLAALPLYLLGGEFFLPFLLTLVAGWACGFWFVGVTVAMEPARRGAVLHLVVGVALVPTLWFGVEIAPDVLPPGGASALGSIVLIGLGPAAGWVWITLIGRVSALVGRRSAQAAPAPPTWQGRGDETSVTVRAIPLRMRTLTAAVAGAVGVAAAIALVPLLLAGSFVLALGPRIVVIAFGLLLAFPAYLALTAWLRRGTVHLRVTFVGDELRIEADGREHEVRLPDVHLLRWRTDSDYARVELVTATLDLSYVVGLAKQTPGIQPGLPALPPRMLRAAERAGLEAERDRRGVLTLRRSV